MLEDSLKRELIKSSNDSLNTLIYQKLAWEKKYSQPRESFVYLDSADKLAKKVESPILTANILYYRAVIHYLVDENVDAITYANDALRIYESEIDDYGKASIFNLLGLINNRLGDFQSTIYYYQQSLKIAEKGSNLYAVSNPYHNIALVYIDMGEYEKALEPASEAFEVRKEIGDSTYIGQSMETIGVIHYHLGNYQLSQDFLLNANKIFERLADVNSLSINYSNLGLVFLDTKRFSTAIDHFLLAIEKCIQVENHEGLCNAYNNLSSAYFELKQSEKAEKYARMALALAEEYQLLPNLKESYRSLMLALESAQEFQEAYMISKRLSLVSDSLLNSEKSKEIANLEVRFETAKKEQQIILQAAQISKQEIQNQRNIAIIAGLVLAISLVVGVFLLNRNRLLKKQRLLVQEAEILLREAQIEAAITSQEKERSRFAKDLHDGFGQMISTLNLNLKSLEAGEKDKHAVFESLSKVLEDMYQELKGICFNLMPQTLIKHGITAALNEFATRINTADKLHVATDFFGLENRLTDLQEISLYRITQEWVNNVIKYSDATKVTIQITRDQEELTLLIEDNGLGFDLELLKSGKGNGWRNMNSRANLINGELEVDTSPGIKGNTLIVNVPVAIEEAILV